MVVERTRAVKNGERGIMGTGRKEGGMTLPAAGGRWSPAEDRNRHRCMLNAHPLSQTLSFPPLPAIQGVTSCLCSINSPSLPSCPHQLQDHLANGSNSGTQNESCFSFAADGPRVVC